MIKKSLNIDQFRQTILKHYNQEKRDFPWRETNDPYAILTSEIMLQQTQTDRVVPKYLAWLDSFPDIHALAQAETTEVLERWVGLGYNRRAIFLHRAAKIMDSEYNGFVPQELTDLLSLPGIGPYTARAIRTFAWGYPEVFIETNIRSVFLFFFFPDQTAIDDSNIMPLIESSLYLEDPRTWYYALMDYGSVLKRKTINPNRNSKHYSKQSRFTGSNREARGAIVRTLSTGARYTITDLATQCGLDRERITKALLGLTKEGIVCDMDGVYGIYE